MATSPLPSRGPGGGGEFNMATSPLPCQGPHGGDTSIWGMGKIGDSSNVPHPKCIERGKNPEWNKKVVKKGQKKGPSIRRHPELRSVCTAIPQG